MAPFRRPSPKHNLMLAIEVTARNPQTKQEWIDSALILSKEFSTADNQINLKGRGCRERVERLLEKYQQDDRKSLKRSGTEEEYTELHRLLEDITIYRRDMQELKDKQVAEKEQKKRKEMEDKQKGQQMRKEAMEGMYKLNHDSSSEDDNDSDDSYSTGSSGKKVSKTKVVQKRGTKRSAVQMLETKYERKAELKEKELELRKEELELQKRKYEDESCERKERLQLEIEERRMFLNILKDKL